MLNLVLTPVLPGLNCLCALCDAVDITSDHRDQPGIGRLVRERALASLGQDPGPALIPISWALSVLTPELGPD